MSTQGPTTSSSAASRAENSDIDLFVAIGSALGFMLLSFGLLAMILWRLHRRKKKTGTFFKAARYSLASTGTGPLHEKHPEDAAVLARHDHHDHGNYHDHHDSYYRDEEASPAPIIPPSSTIRDVHQDLTGYYRDPAPPHPRRSVERVRRKQLVSGRQNTPPDTAAEQAAASAPAATQTNKARALGVLPLRRQYPESPESGETTPRGRPLFVTQSPTTTSSGHLESRGSGMEWNHGGGGGGGGGGNDDPTPVMPSLPSYRERRPADLTLPTAENRFRNGRLVPAVHFSPDVSPVGHLTPSPPDQQRRHGVSPPTPSPNGAELTPLTAVHYPSWSEVSEFDFVGEGGFRPRPSRNRRYHDGGDGWRPGRDSVFGRYEMG